MRPVPPPVPRAATAARPDWAELPAELRAAVADRLGSPVRTARTAGAGFTGGFAAVLETAAGGRAFVKAAAVAEQPHLADWYAREAAVTSALPPGIPAPRPHWTLATAGHVVLCLDAVDGRMPALPWAPAELAATLTAYAGAAAALADPPDALLAVGLPRLADLARADLSWWREIADGREPVPTASPAGRQRADELAATEALLPGYAEPGGVIHCDLRADNVLIDQAGAVWFCDWTWACQGPAWFDLVGLLIGGYASGLDADALFAAHPAAGPAPPDGLDAALAALSGYLLTAAADPAADTPPQLRAHRRWSGETALAWLARRRGW